jgi:hypothetical protein
MLDIIKADMTRLGADEDVRVKLFTSLMFSYWNQSPITVRSCAIMQIILGLPEYTIPFVHPSILNLSLRAITLGV